MHTDTTVHAKLDTPVFGYTLPVCGKTVGYLKVGTDENYVTFIITDPAFLDKLANEAERLCREIVGDVPPLEPLPAPETISYAAIGGVTP